jgi:hypothetical protein
VSGTLKIDKVAKAFGVANNMDLVVKRSIAGVKHGAGGTISFSV